ncbi:four helix bundle protein [Dyella sp.]|uniref:four helix bundle protein n=1 Tax=Dyella sp. TaxID=1869338 RepID=UPI00284385C2|nr:four helix bundle protein [Dyella sp.]MDR3445945.1 four helix bundle protein [Dyella sp.]
MNTTIPPIMKKARTFRAEIERTVGRFRRSHRYSLGTRLCSHAERVVSLTNRAWRDSANAAKWVSDLSWALDDLGEGIQTAKDLGLISANHLGALALMKVDLGRMVGGWKRSLQHPNSQNGGSVVSRQRAVTLSARGASAEANL